MELHNFSRDRGSYFVNDAFETKPEKTEDVVSNAKNGNPVSTVPDKEKSANNDQLERGQWASKTEFILSCIGLSVGIGNVWRFPFLAYQNGGGAFVIPYIILMFLVGKPLYYMELSLGQFSSLGPLAVWRCLPVAKGIAMAQIVVSIIVCVYYNVILAYTVFYMAQSFRSEIPWARCMEWWGANESNCFVRSSGIERCSEVENRLYSTFSNQTDFSFENDDFRAITLNNKTVFVASDFYDSAYANCSVANQTASQLFWEKYVLQITDGIGDLGGIRWELLFCLFISWLIVFLCLMKGVKSSGKVVYFTATFPYVVIIILLIRGLLLPGALTGVKYFLVPEWNRMLDVTIWRKAAEQLFYSLGVCQGAILMFGSYNKFRNPVDKDALFISTMDFFTSIIGGIVIFSILGNMSEELGIDIKKVAKAGQGLAFVAYPEALARLPFPQLWTFLFFFMLFLLGLDSEFAMLETVLTVIYDKYPNTRKRKVLLTFVGCTVCFFLGIPCVMQGGQYVLNLMDTYGGGFAVIFIAFCEVVALMWVYGVKNFSFDLQYMLGKKTNWYWKITWVFFSPVILGLLFVYGVSTHEPIKYDDVIVYPTWADVTGLALAFFSIGQIPLWAIIVLIQNRKDVRKAFVPKTDWGPSEFNERMEYQKEKTLQNTSTGLEVVPRY